MALGSTPGNMLWLVLKEGLGLTAAGLAVGFLIAVGIGQVVGSMLYEVSGFDPVVFVVAPLVLAALRSRPAICPRAGRRASRRSRRCAASDARRAALGPQLRCVRQLSEV